MKQQKKKRCQINKYEKKNNLTMRQVEKGWKRFIC